MKKLIHFLCDIYTYIYPNSKFLTPISSALKLEHRVYNQSVLCTSIALAFVGTIVPDEPAFHNLAFSRAGNMSQYNLLNALSSAGLPPSLILSQRPVRLFPRSKTLWVSAGHVWLSNGLSVNLLPYINFSLLRPLCIGLMVVVNLIHWGWRHRNIKYRVVYTYNLTEPFGLFTLLAAKLIRAKSVASIYDINLPGETVPNTFIRRIIYWFTKWLIKRFDGLVVINDQIARDFAPDSSYIRMEGGISQEVVQYFSNYNKETIKNNNSFVIAFAGSLTEENGIIEILQAFSLLQCEHYRLIIAGAGPFETDVRHAAEHDSRIEYRGFLSFDEVLALYKEADILINMRLTKKLNTRYFFPSKLLEYLASGTPVITTCTGHVEEEYSEFAFILYDESPQGLASMIEYVASLPSDIRMRKGRAAKDFIQTHKTWKAQGYRVVEFIYRDVLRCNREKI